MKIIAVGLAVMLGLSGAVIAAGWDDLFNGRDLDGWEAQSKVDWQVKDALQFNQGRVEFRNVRIQKLGLP